MKRLLRLIVLFVFLVSLAGVNNAAVASPAESSDAPVVSATPGGISLSWQVPPAEFSQAADGQVSVKVAGVENETAPGAPELPVLSLLVAIPPQASPSIQMGKISMQPRALSGQMRLAPKAQPVLRADGTEIDVDESNLAVSIPQVLATFEEAGIMRGVRLGRLVLRPVLLEGSQFTVFTHVELNLNFNAVVVPSNIQNDALIDQVRATVVNPSQVQSTLAQSNAGESIQPGLPSAHPDLLMQITDAGLYKISYTDLLNAGFAPATVNPLNIHILHAGQEVAYEWADGLVQDTQFNSNETILFYAKPTPNRWSNFDTYVLSYSETTPGTLMQTRGPASGTPTTGTVYFDKTYELNTIYMGDLYPVPPIDMGRDGDPWMWTALKACADCPSEFRIFSTTFNLGAFDAAKDAKLILYLNGSTPLSHSVAVEVNGIQVGTVVWSGKTMKLETINLAANVLASSSNNTLTLKMRQEYIIDGIWLDAFTVRYQPTTSPVSNDLFFKGAYGNVSDKRSYSIYLNSASSALVYDVTNSDIPVRLTGFTVAGNKITLEENPKSVWSTYLATTNQHSVSLRQRKALLTGGLTTASYVMVAPPEFIAGLNTLKNHRISYGQTAVIEDLQAIYDHYADGIASPLAIQAYLKAAYINWSPKPLYAVLVGDGTSDPKQYRADSPKTWIPPFFIFTDFINMEDAADNRFVTFDGSSDVLADMMIGRLSVNSTIELATVTTKIINYEKNTPKGGWRATALLLADYQEAGDANFYALDNALAAEMTVTPYIIHKLYNASFDTSDATRLSLMQKWNAGAALVAYAGHAFWEQWGKGELLHSNHVTQLTNGAKLPIVLSLTCDTSRFYSPVFHSLDEDLMRFANGGAIATFGSTTRGNSGDHQILGTTFIKTLQSGPTTVGVAMTAAKIKLISLEQGNPRQLYHADTYMILGDPAVKVQLSYPQTTYLPLIGK